jgi:hypothetical protein
MNFTHNVVPTVPQKVVVPQVNESESTNNNALETYDVPYRIKAYIAKILVN